ncbi:ribosomal protein S18 acetylase RimI-like enzyme [Kribbella amoyensis]|uniref:Ribosomal protein S18 acetylase RimI-like enzyme n=1 Tax=Kribbella amoyensis TaxID=996641 RepID=A0A561BYC0_9ACTN|nr:GNAT family N-acetyltransferase [Kribbella amoyensis]TWD83890.1 ribosomal protein S18 acetylase RimI-like enzyme [Kribbella amoyensis]
MTSPLELPASFVSRPATVADVGAIHQLVRAVELDLVGQEETGADAIEASLTRPGFDASADSLVVVDENGELAGWAWVNRGRRSQVDVHPDFRGRGVGTALVGWVELRAKDVGVEWVSQTVDDLDVAGTELLRARGYEVLATNWLLEMAVADGQPAVPDGIVIRPFQPGDEQAVYQVIQDAFDDWQPRRKEYEEWARMTIERASFAPGISPVAIAGDEVVGAVLCLDLPGATEGYVDELAVRKDQRGRGVARALLAAAAEGIRRQGLDTVTLWTHSGTGALAMYERLGMRVRRSTTVYRVRT